MIFVKLKLFSFQKEKRRGRRVEKIQKKKEREDLDRRSDDVMIECIVKVKVFLNHYKYINF